MMTGKKVLLTGASKGIGFATAKKLLEEHAEVLITGRNEKALIESCEKLGNKNIDYIVWDVSDVGSMKEHLAQAVEKLGRIDVLINNAGILTQNDFGGMFAVTPESWDYTINVNLKGVFFMCQTVAQYMIDNGIKGRIVNTCSNNAFRAKDTAYAASKWAIRGLTQGFGKALAPYGIRVNAVAPGCTSTSILGVEEGSEVKFDECGLGRYSYPSEIADVITFLASEHSGTIIGQTIVSDGGEILI